MIMKSNTISPEVEKLLSSRSMIAWAVFIVVGAVVALSRLFSHIEMMSIVPHIFGFYALGCCGFVLLYTDIVDPKSGKYYGKNRLNSQNSVVIFLSFPHNRAVYPLYFSSMNKKCPKCSSISVKKDGHRNLRQSYKCKDCGHVFQNASRIS